MYGAFDKIWGYCFYAVGATSAYEEKTFRAAETVGGYFDN